VIDLVLGALDKADNTVCVYNRDNVRLILNICLACFATSELQTVYRHVSLPLVAYIQ
jgi:hypothetical protein